MKDNAEFWVDEASAADVGVIGAASEEILTPASAVWGGTIVSWSFPALPGLHEK